MADLQSTLRTQRAAIAEAKAMAKKCKKKTNGSGRPTRAAKVRALAKVKAADIASSKKKRVEFDGHWRGRVGGRRRGRGG